MIIKLQVKKITSHMNLSKFQGQKNGSRLVLLILLSSTSLSGDSVFILNIFNI